MNELKEKLVEEIIDALFELLKPDVMGGDDAVFSSGYGSGPIVINLRKVAEGLLEKVTFPTTEGG